MDPKTDMKKLPKQTDAKIEKCRKRVHQLAHKQDLLYELLLKETGIEDNGWLFDYVFNCSLEADSTYEKMVKREVFGYVEE